MGKPERAEKAGKNRMIKVFYEDRDLIVVEKPVGVESQSARRFEPDMVSEIKKHINNLFTAEKEPYVGVIHRLDKPVRGIMVYAKTPKAAAALSKQIQNGSFKKGYQAVVCGKLVDTVGNFVDYMWKDPKTNDSQIVDKSVPGAKRAELNYRLLGTTQEEGMILSLVEIQLLTGRHHQIRVQFAHHGTPIWGDNRYHPQFRGKDSPLKGSIALCATGLEFVHPISNKKMAFSMESELEGMVKKH